MKKQDTKPRPAIRQNLAPANVYFCREKEVLSRREQIKQQTLAERRAHHFNTTQMINAA